MAAAIASPLMSEELSPFNVFVGVDFGTTFSGFAFALGQDSEEIRVQPQAGASNRKLPTALLLNERLELVAFGHEAFTKYFEELDEKDDLEKLYFFDRFKMKLHNDQNVDGSTAIRASNGKEVPAKAVFARSLEYFFKTASEVIPRAFGVPLRPEEVKWIITVPAIWGERAKKFMLDAATEAGMKVRGDVPNVEIALEPEAAALSCRKDLQAVWMSQGRPQTMRYIVADCGGGTVDVTIHDLKMTMNSGSIDEVEPASGDAWGGTLVDRHMEELVARILGQEIMSKVDDNAWLYFSRTKLEDGKKMTDTLSKAAIQLTQELHQAVTDSGGTLPAESMRMQGVTYRQAREKLLIDKALIDACYAEPVDRIVEHVLAIKRRCKNVNAVLMVGGFSASQLLIKRIQEAVQTDDCRVIRPENPDLSVVKGAVMYGQNPKLIQSRIARHSYGIDVKVEFMEEEHEEHRRVVEGGRAFCNHVFKPYIRAGQRIHVGSVEKCDINPTCSKQKGMKLQLYYSPHADVKYTDEAGCQELLLLRLAMPDIEGNGRRLVQTMVDFSRTSLHFKAIDAQSQQRADTSIEYKN